MPLDGSKESEAILAYVSQLAKGLDIPILVLSVIEQHDHWGTASLRQRLAKEVESGANKRLREVVGRLGRDGVRAEAVTTRGRAADEIIATAKRQRCDLIAMTTHGANLIARGILGSVTDKVVHSSQLPVLTITPERAVTYGSRRTWFRVFTSFTAPMIQNIMVPLDGSPRAETVLPYVQALARKLSLRVLLVTVIRGGLGVESLEWGHVDTNEEMAAKVEAGKYLETISEALRGAGINAQWQVRVGHPARSIVDLAQQHPHDIIALATHRGPSWALGSVAEALVRGTGDPVLVVMSITSE